jgi:hypothetical protein
MFARSGAGDIKQPPLGFVDIVQLGFISGIGNAFVEWQNSLVARHNNNSPELEPFSRAHGNGHNFVHARKPSDRGSRTGDKLRGADEQADLTGCDALVEPGFDGFTNGLGFNLSAGERFELRRGAFENGDDPPPLVLQPIGVTQHHRQQPVGGTPYLLRGTIADFQRM